MSTVQKEQRHTRARPCLICGGGDDDKRKQGIRCSGFQSGEYVYCSREQCAGDLPCDGPHGTYCHWLGGPCKCGKDHSGVGSRPAHKADSNGHTKKPIEYHYLDADGNLLFQALRYNPKGFKQRRPDPEKLGKWIWNTTGVETVLYHLPELLKADPAKIVFIPEGEKDVDRLRRSGLVATCNPMGAGKWLDRYSESLRGRFAVILPDNDDTGRDHSTDVAKSLDGIASRIKVVNLPGLPERGDVSDYLDKHTIADLLALVGDAPDWQPEGGFSGSSGSPNQILENIGAAPGGSSGSSGSPNQESEKFEGDPQPLTVDLLKVPPMDVDMLPEAFRVWLWDFSERTFLPPDYAAVSAMVALGALVSRKLMVRPKQYDDWYVVPNLWGGIVGPPGLIKTAAGAEGQRPLRGLEALAGEAHSAAMVKHKVAIEVRAAMAKAAKNDLEKSARREGATFESLMETAMEKGLSEEAIEPTPTRYIVGDATIEKVQDIMITNPGLLQFRDELTGWLRTMDRQGHENDRSFYLESWDGSNPYPLDRMVRGSSVVPRNCLSVFGTIQPGPLARYIRLASTLSEGNDGLLQRFQLLVYPDHSKDFAIVDRPPHVDGWKIVEGLFEKLNRFDPVQRELSYDARKKVHYVGFDPEAQALFYDWWVKLEIRIRSGDLPAAHQAHISKYRSLMPALALLIYLASFETIGDGCIMGPVVAIPLTAAEMAIKWCEYLEQHAKRIYASAFDGDIEPAERLADRIKEGLPNPFKPHDIVRKGWKGLDTDEEVRLAINILEDKNWVKLVHTKPSPSGGRPSDLVWINPKLLPPVTP